ncbi:interleukin-5 receptor subunit alpha [Spea bombifrons]|uniref:interleukin-5 receptor subunit alpha n=1 Tax=Spea bombifrons TaxID=233779 RepID=UPI00234BEF2F|nr:interleukin-5 receptor subunit alpha [Spea bombifrons]
MTVPTFGEVLLSWKPCPASNSTQDIKYFVNISTPDYDEQYYTQRCNSSRILALHRGLHAQVSITKWNQGVQLSLSVPLSKVLRPTGEEGTAATNLSCLIHTRESLNISLTCNWTAGAKAPLDTQYYLYYRCVEAPADAVSFIVPSRFGNKAEKCHEYVTERGGQRHTGCYVPSSYIELFGLNDQILVLINGSSRTRGIQSIDHVYETSSIGEWNRNSGLEESSLHVIGHMPTL